MKKLISAFLFVFLVLVCSKGTLALTTEEAALMDLNTPCGFSAEELSAGLKGELVALANDFAAAEKEFGVNAIFLAALAAQESGWGKHCFLPNNIFGWSGKSFDSKSKCIEFVASRLAEKYLSEEGSCFNGKNLYGVNVAYNGNESWVIMVADIMAQINRRVEQATQLLSEYGSASASFCLEEEYTEESDTAEPVPLSSEVNSPEIWWICSCCSNPESTANGQCAHW